MLTHYLVKNVLEIEVKQIPSVQHAQMENTMIQSAYIVKNVQTNITNTVPFVMLQNVKNVLKTENSPTVLVFTDTLKLTESVNLVHTIVKIVT